MKKESLIELVSVEQDSFKSLIIKIFSELPEDTALSLIHSIQAEGTDIAKKKYLNLLNSINESKQVDHWQSESEKLNKKVNELTHEMEILIRNYKWHSDERYTKANELEAVREELFLYQWLLMTPVMKFQWACSSFSFSKRS